MRKTIIVSVAVILLGLGYAWWWHQTVQEMTAVATGTAAKLQDWASLRKNYPRFAVTARLMRLDLFSKSETASREAVEMMQRMYRAAGLHSMCGLLIAALAAGFLGGFTFGQRSQRKRISEPEVAPYR